MANKKITQLPASTTPLTGSEIVPVVQSGATVQTSVNSLGPGIGYTPAGAGAVARTVQAKLRESVSVKDFGAVGDGVTDDTAAIQAWIAALTAATYKFVGYVPPGRYKHTQPLVWSALRNLTIKGVGGNSVQVSSSFEFVGDPVTHIDGGIRVTSCYNVVFEGISFINRTSGLNYCVNVNAMVSPALSCHLVEFNNCGFTTGAGIAPTIAGILVANSKMVKFNNCFIDTKSRVAILFGLDQSASPSTLMTGANQCCSVENCFVYGDFDLRQIFGFSLKSCSLPETPTVGGASSVVCSGDQKVSDVEIANCYFEQNLTPAGGADSRPAIYTGAYAGSSDLSPSAGWLIFSNTFRDRGIGVQIARGGVQLDANVFMQRSTGIGPVVQKGVVIDATVSGAAAISISSSNDFSMADTNNFVAIEDNRTTIADSVVFSGELATDTALSAIGSYVSVISGAEIRADRGGKYRITYNVTGLATSLGAGFYRARVTIGGVDYGTVARVSVGASESFNIGLSRIVKIPSATAAKTVVLAVEQESGTGAATIRSGTSANGATYVQLEELP
jgi:hypothetical protein